MIFSETELKGAFVIDPELLKDDRGFFARIFCVNEFRNRGLVTKYVQCNISFNLKKGTLRGMHYQAKPHEEVKLVQCIKGSIYDVIIDLRKDSPTFRKWITVELTERNHRMFYIPEGFAHGFQTLEDNTEVFYQMAEFYSPEYAWGVRWDDPVFNISWPLNAVILSDRDKSYSLSINNA